MPVLFGQWLFGPPELFNRNKYVGKLASIRPEPNAAPVVVLYTVTSSIVLYHTTLYSVTSLVVDVPS